MYLGRRQLLEPVIAAHSSVRALFDRKGHRIDAMVHSPESVLGQLSRYDIVSCITTLIESGRAHLYPRAVA